jgi:hypothetical protein
MTLMHSARALALGALVAVAQPGGAAAGAADFEFQVLEQSYNQGEAVVSVRLIDKRSGQAVPDADMAPDGMEVMTAPVNALSSDEPGVYRFKTNLSMEGGWRFSIAAKVQGEHETVVNRLILQVHP